MELWEGAILVVGGVILVGYMSQKNQAAVLGAQAAAAAATTVAPGGTSNESNLTTITNTAGGQPTVYGEPLSPPQAPIIPGGVVGPATTGLGARPPRANPVRPVAGFRGAPVTSATRPGTNGDVGPVAPVKNPPAWVGSRPMDQHL
jgi:hypothetical protein